MIYQLEVELAETNIDRPTKSLPAQTRVSNTCGNNQKLNQGELLSIDLLIDQKLHLFVQTGEIWLTIEGDKNDYVLRAGDELSVSCEGRVVIEGLEPSIIELS